MSVTCPRPLGIPHSRRCSLAPAAHICVSAGGLVSAVCWEARRADNLCPLGGALFQCLMGGRVSWGCRDKFAQTWWFPTTSSLLSRFWRPKVQNQDHWSEVRVAGTVVPLEALRGECIPCLLQPWLLLASLALAWGCSPLWLHGAIVFSSSVCVKSPFLPS